jgi:subtilisin family serine protease
MLKVAVLVALGLAMVLSAPAPISPTLKHIIKTKGSVDVIINMRETTYSVLNQLKLRSYVNREARLNSVASALKSFSAESQKSVLAYLATKENIKVKSIWISNKISVKGADADLLQGLAAMSEIGSIVEDAVIPLHKPVSSATAAAPKAPTWGVEIIEAQAAWDMGYKGQGVVVATIDTGVRYTHKNLYRQWRQNYGWFDPYESTGMPEDTQGHGTHTMGTIIGSDGIGVAPEATFIACLGCEALGCTISALEGCGEFVACPTLPDGTEPMCSLAPHLVSNSWGGSGGQDFYDATIAAWKTAGIIPLFSNGNSGSSCYSAGSPADSVSGVIAVGATDDADELAYFSSIGPSNVDDSVKPDISAPGVDVLSSYYLDDEAFYTMSGTSMACPHVAGVTALLLSNGTQLTYEAVADLLYSGATQTVAETGANCGGIDESTYPNNHVGWGRLSASASIAKLHKNLHL